MFDLKNYGEVIFYDTEKWCKKSQIWDFNGILLSKLQNV